jgi:hypothetical protein
VSEQRNTKNLRSRNVSSAGHSDAANGRRRCRPGAAGRIGDRFIIALLPLLLLLLSLYTPINNIEISSRLPSLSKAAPSISIVNGPSFFFADNVFVVDESYNETSQPAVGSWQNDS